MGSRRRVECEQTGDQEIEAMNGMTEDWDTFEIIRLQTEIVNLKGHISVLEKAIDTQTKRPAMKAKICPYCMMKYTERQTRLTKKRGRYCAYRHFDPKTGRVSWCPNPLNKK